MIYARGRQPFEDFVPVCTFFSLRLEVKHAGGSREIVSKKLPETNQLVLIISPLQREDTCLP